MLKHSKEAGAHNCNRFMVEITPGVGDGRTAPGPLILFFERVAALIIALIHIEYSVCQASFSPT